MNKDTAVILIGLILFVAANAIVASVRMDRDARDARSDRARLDSLESRLADLARASHGRRAALADELRREFRAADEKLAAAAGRLAAGAGAELEKEVRAARSAVAAESVIRGQQVTAERRERRRDVAQLADETAAAGAMLLREQDARSAAIDGLSARIAAMKGCRCGAVSPNPPPVPSKTPPAAVPAR